MQKYLSEYTKLNRYISNQFIGDFSAGRIKSLLMNGTLNQLSALYKAMLERDAHLSGEMVKRTINVISAGYVIECKDDKIKAFAEDYLRGLKINSLLTDMLSAVSYGFSVFDLIWEKKGNHLVPKAVFLDQTYFESDREGLYLTLSNFKKLYITDDKKFLVHLHKTSSGSITSFGLLKKLAWIFTLKNFVMAHYVKYTEILGVPPVIIQTDAGEPEKVVDQVLELRSGGAGYFPKESVVTLLSGKASDTEFMNFIKYADSIISQTVLGGNLTSNVESGSKAAATVHNDVRTDYMRNDAFLVEETINSLLRTVIDMNFNTSEYPVFKFDIEEYLDEKTKAETLQILKNMGYELPVDYISQLFKIPKTDKGDAVLTSTEQNNRLDMNAQGSIKPADEVDKQYLSLAKSHISPTEDEIIKKLVSILKTSDSFEAAFKALTEAYPDFSLETLEEVFFNVTANTELYGFVDAD